MAVIEITSHNGRSKRLEIQEDPGDIGQFLGIYTRLGSERLIRALREIPDAAFPEHWGFLNGVFWT
jgi:hypothetical protein